MHCVEEGDIWENSRIVNVWRANQNISKQSGHAITQHLGAYKESNAPSRIYPPAIVQLHGRQRAEPVRRVTLEKLILGAKDS